VAVQHETIGEHMDFQWNLIRENVRGTCSYKVFALIHRITKEAIDEQVDTLDGVIMQVSMEPSDE
jgi:hypothetical protein